jgi:hypothetical protein
LLLCAAGREAGEAGLQPLLRRGVDWEYLLDLGLRHGLLPLARERLRRLEPGLVPPPVLDRLERGYYTSLRRNLRLAAGLAEAVAALQAAGIEPIVLKGGALAGTVYPDPGLRPMLDLDLLVPVAAMGRAGSALAAIGYHLPPGLPACPVAFQQRFGGGLDWLRQGGSGPLAIDLQHDLVGVDFCRHAFGLEPAALRAAARPLPLVRGQALQLSAEDTLIHLCLHPALHDAYALPLLAYVDIDRLLAGEACAAFWQRLAERAAQFRVRAVVYHGLRRARALLGTPVPDGTLAALAPGRLRAQIVARLAPLDEGRVWAGTDRPLSGLRQLLLYAALMDRPRDALGMVRAILFPGREWLALRYGLPDGRQARLYGLLHPLRVARAFLRGLRRPLVHSSLE